MHPEINIVTTIMVSRALGEAVAKLPEMPAHLQAWTIKKCSTGFHPVKFTGNQVCVWNNFSVRQSICYFLFAIDSIVHQQI